MIVNADDLAYDEGRNTAILALLERGLVDRATVMANMPGFDDAATRVRAAGLEQRVGIHLVLSEGTPLTEGIRRLPTFCDANGEFRQWRYEHIRPWLPRAERDALVAELTAQVERCRAHGLPVAHLDSHHHVHNEPSVALTVIRAAKRAGIESIRIARNCQPDLRGPKRAYKSAFNALLRAQGLAASRLFGTLDDLESLLSRPGDTRWSTSFELMVHPDLAEDGSIVESGRPGRPLDLELERLRGGGSQIANRVL
ncbi:MAG TPA: ChbG/HpnK family deacetylase [Gaiellaceae bacterium]|nr:ChbG/HpnK family deacetylase [Gaiellaceae bacterium]